jgi:hypothetical protein
LQSPVRLGQKNVHRVGRVSGGLLNPSGGARNRPRNKSVLAQLENELNHNFASGAKIRLTYFGKNKAILDPRCWPREAEPFTPLDSRHDPGHLNPET